ncbi:MAG TPA: secretion protein HlyD, partial [Spirochaetia bacterium]|nr:secretion protein HlyD [Spirochaetia bacterium]
PVSGVVPVVALFADSFAPSYGTVGTVSYSVTLAEGVIVPIGALQTNENQNFVFAVVNGKAAARPIRILGETGVAAAVAGVDPGSAVILYPPPGLLDGSAVKPLAAEQTSAAGPSAAGKAPAGGRP